MQTGGGVGGFDVVRGTCCVCRGWQGQGRATGRTSGDVDAGGYARTQKIKGPLAPGVCGGRPVPSLPINARGGVGELLCKPRARTAASTAPPLSSTSSSSAASL